MVVIYHNLQIPDRNYIFASMNIIPPILIGTLMIKECDNKMYKKLTNTRKKT